MSPYRMPDRPPHACRWVYDFNGPPAAHSLMWHCPECRRPQPLGDRLRAALRDAMPSLVPCALGVVSLAGIGAGIVMGGDEGAALALVSWGAVPVGTALLCAWAMRS